MPRITLAALTLSLLAVRSAPGPQAQVPLAQAQATDEFLTNLHKADNRSEPDERIEYYSRAIRAWRTGNGASLLAHCHFNRGETHLNLARLDLAETDLAKALSLDPGNARAYLLRGRLHLRTARAKAAEKDLREYASMKPSDADGRILLGESRERAGRLSDALKDFQQASRLDAWNWRAFVSMARVLTTQRKYGPAGQMLDKAETLAGGREAAVATQRGLLLKETLKFEEAVEKLGLGINLHEEKAAELQRSVGKALDLQECRESLSLAYHGRGATHEKLLNPGAALSDYHEACRLGHAPSCILAERQALRPPPAEVHKPPHPKPGPAPAPKPTPPKKKRAPKPKSDPGERIYGS
ncbi:MAG: tetratricopeptide repeat protein [Elusimicrobia bacterium]|nr:tetratricopeptide repeat protein [Elusimicrobiota bacterium]